MISVELQEVIQGIFWSWRVPFFVLPDACGVLVYLYAVDLQVLKQ